MLVGFEVDHLELGVEDGAVGVEQLPGVEPGVHLGDVLQISEGKIIRFERIFREFCVILVV